MKRQTLAATAVAIYFSLNVEVIDDRRTSDIFALPLLTLTWLIPLFLGLRGACRQMQSKIRNQKSKITLTWNLIEIGWRSLTWGLCT